MENRITTEEVAKQMTKAIQLLLEWARQEMLTPQQHRNGKFVINDKPGENESLPGTDKLLRAKEVADILQVSRSLAYQMMSRGEIPTIRVGSAVRVRRGDLEIFIKKSRDS